MEALENNMVEGAILWLVQTILENLSIPGKLDEWIRRVGLAEDIGKLKIEIERVETVVAAVKGRATGNKPLARSLTRVRELMYDADDVVDELDYFRLQQQVEGGGTACANNDPDGTDLAGVELLVDGTSGKDGPNIPSSSKKRKNRSKAWDHFEEQRDVNGNLCAAVCKSCRSKIKCGGISGTNGLTKHLGKNGKCLREAPSGDHHPTPTSASDLRPNDISDATLHSVFSKRMRTDEASPVTASIYRWNKADSSEKIHQITSDLQGLREAVTEFLKDSVASSDQYQSNNLDACLRTTSLGPQKVYGRDTEKDYIIRVITAAESDVIAVLPIVGIAGVGKTTLAQLVYNDPKVESQFEKIWVCVGYNFDEVTLTREMLEFSQERNEGSPKIQYKHQGINGLGKLQEILKAYLQCRSKRFLLILDDVWDNLDDFRWRRLLLPLQSSHAKGNVILVTTRDLYVAQRIGTEEPIKLDALGKNDFWLLYKSFAFGDDNYGEITSLNSIGQQIAEKLKGNPLAAETAGKILRERLNLEHWSRILKDEDWKSLHLRGGTMCALKLSYDQLPYHLKQCFLYCSIFPNNYHFVAKDLIHTWISLGFVRCINSGKKLEEIGQECLTNLVNLGFLKQVERTKASLCGIMHDFGRLVSKTEWATIDGLEFNKIPPTIRHLSIVTDSAYLRDQHGPIVRNENFEKNLQSIFEQAEKLRTLVLLGKYDKYFFKSFQDMLPKVQNLRVLQISSTNCESYSFQGSLVIPLHLRCLKLKIRNDFNDFPQALSKWYHIQVLDLDDSITFHTAAIGISNLVSLHHLVASKGVYSDSVGKVTCLHELNISGCDLANLQSMSELVQLGVYKLQNVTSRYEAYGARLKEKRNLEKLQLSWQDSLAQDEHDSLEERDSEKESSHDSEEESSQVNFTSFEYFAGIASDVLDGLEPHRNLKYLQVSGYGGAESPAWLGASVSFLRTLHLEDCGEWGELRFLGSLSFLTKLKLINMHKVEDISIPSLEELVLIQMPKLERCSCDSVRNLNSSLRVLKIEGCRKLRAFPLFGSCGIKQKSWLFHLRELMIHECPDLVVSHPLPPSSSICELSIRGVRRLPKMIGSSDEYLNLDCEYSNEIGTDILAFHNLRVLRNLAISDCDYPIFSSLEGFRQLINLKSLKINSCKNLLSSNVLQEDTCDSFEETYQGNKEVFSKLTSLEELSIMRCPGLLSSCVHKDENDKHTNGRWLLPQSLVKLEINYSIESETLELCFPGHVIGLKTLEVGANPHLESLQLHYCTSLEELFIYSCDSITALEGLPSLGGLRHFLLYSCPRLVPYLERVLSEGYDMLHQLEILSCTDDVLTTSLCEHLVSLERLEIWRNYEEATGLTDEQEKALQLLTSLQELRFDSFYLGDHFPVLHSLPSLKRLEMWSCHCLSSLTEKGFPPSLEELEILCCNQELTDQCRMLATSKLKVKINWKYVNP